MNGRQHTNEPIQQKNNTIMEQKTNRTHYSLLPLADEGDCKADRWLIAAIGPLGQSKAAAYLVAAVAGAVADELIFRLLA